MKDPGKDKIYRLTAQSAAIDHDLCRSMAMTTVRASHNRTTKDHSDHKKQDQRYKHDLFHNIYIISSKNAINTLVFE